MGEVQDSYRQISRATGIIVGLTLVDKVLAVAKETLTAYWFGVSAELDAFNIALAFPGVLTLLLSGAIVSAIVPLYLEWSHKYSPVQADRRAVHLFYFLGLLFIFATLAGFAASPFLIDIMGYGFDVPQKVLAVALQRILMLIIILDGFGIVLRGLLQARKSFFGLTAAPIFVNCFIIGMLLFGRDLGIHALVWGTVLGTFCKTAYMLVLLSRQGMRFVPAGLPSKETIAAFAVLVFPMLGSELMSNSNLLVDQAMATQLTSGSVSTLRYAYRINDLPVQVVVLAISRTIFPYVAEQRIRRDAEALRECFKHIVILLGFLSFPMACLAGLFSREAVGILLQRGAFDATAADETAQTLVFYSLGLFLYAYTFVNGTFFSAMKDVKTLFIMGCLATLLNATFNLLFMRWIGVQGIALSATVTQGLISIIFMRIIKKRLAIDTISEIFRNLVPVAVACVALIMAGYWLRMCFLGLDISPVLFLPAAGFILGISYLALLRFICLDELRTSVTLIVPRNLVNKILGPPRGW